MTANHRLLRKVLGYCFIIFTMIGFLFGLLGLIEVWRIRPIITSKVTDNLGLLDQALGTTESGLQTVGSILKATAEDVKSLQKTTEALVQTIQDAEPTFTALASLTGKELPSTIQATQDSLASAQGSALLIDNIMSTLTSIPFLSLSPYKPEVPLHIALGQVSDSLNSLPPALTTIKNSLVTSKSDMDTMQGELRKISDTATGVSASLDNAQSIISQYQRVTIELKQRVEAAKSAASGAITTLAWILSFFLVWFLIAQVGLWWQGYDMVNRSREGHSSSN